MPDSGKDEQEKHRLIYNLATDAVYYENSII